MRRNLILECEFGAAVGGAATVTPDDDGKVAGYGVYFLGKVYGVVGKRRVFDVDLERIRVMRYRTGVWLKLLA
jgi:hypothetical protein